MIIRRKSRFQADSLHEPMRTRSHHMRRRRRLRGRGCGPAGVLIQCVVAACCKCARRRAPPVAALPSPCAATCVVNLHGPRARTPNPAPWCVRGVGGLMPGKASHVRHALKASRANGGVGYSMRIEIPTSYWQAKSMTISLAADAPTEVLGIMQQADSARRSDRASGRGLPPAAGGGGCYGVAARGRGQLVAALPHAEAARTENTGASGSGATVSEIGRPRLLPAATSSFSLSPSVCFSLPPFLSLTHSLARACALFPSPLDLA